MLRFVFGSQGQDQVVCRVGNGHCYFRSLITLSLGGADNFQKSRLEHGPRVKKPLSKLDIVKIGIEYVHRI